MDYLRKSCSVRLPDDGPVTDRKRTYQFAAEQVFGRVTVSVFLGTERQRKQWAHSLLALGLKATQVSDVECLVSFSVTGHRRNLETLCGYPSIRAVDWRELALPRFGAVVEKEPARREPPVHQAVRVKAALARRALVRAAEAARVENGFV